MHVLIIFFLETSAIIITFSGYNENRYGSQYLSVSFASFSVSFLSELTGSLFCGNMKDCIITRKPTVRITAIKCLLFIQDSIYSPTSSTSMGMLAFSVTVRVSSHVL